MAVDRNAKSTMNNCQNCGLLLFEQAKGRKLCKACQLAEDEVKHISKTACNCQYCTRNYDWNNKDFLGPNKCHQYPTRSLDDKPQPLPTRYESAVNEDLRKRWEKEQLQLKKNLQTEDSDLIRQIRQKMKKNNLNQGELYIGGVDISFIKGDNVNACSAFVVLSYPDLEVVYEDYKMIKLTAPYIPGFLAFREVEFIVEQYRTLEKSQPQYLPQVIFVDGNGVLHPRGFGLASHLGVLLGVACLGVAKTLIHVDGLEDNDEHKAKKNLLKKGGDTFLLQTSSGHVLGKALRTCDSAQNPVYVSAGHMISLDTAILFVTKCSKYRIPEPTRKADLNSREYLRVNHPQEAS